MLSDWRVLSVLRRSLFAGAVAASLCVGACGGGGSKTPVSTADDDTATADDGTGDTGGTGDTDKVDASTKPPAKTPTATKDASVTKPVTPAIDAATKPAADGSAPSKPSSDGSDAGTPPTSTTAGNSPAAVVGDAPTEASATAMGPFPVKTYTDGYPDSDAYADSTMHYPDGAPGLYPAIAIVPGFASAQSSIQPWGPFLASHGFVVLTIGTNSTLDQPDARSVALLGAIETIKGENTRDGSPIKGKLDLDRLAVGGWSMGGGGTLITINTHPEFKAAICFCPWNPGATFPMAKTPVLFLAAANDELAAGQSQPFYDSIPDTTPKLLWERSDADHFNNDPTYEMGAMGRYGLSWLKTFLAGDDRYRQFLLVKGPNASDWKSNVM